MITIKNRFTDKIIKEVRAADLRAADLSAANLIAANLRAANLIAADLSNANLRAANLIAADLSAANLSNANLSNANLSAANLIAADLSNANLRAANLSNARGLLDPATWLAENFEKSDAGIIVYKRIGNTDYWKSADGQYSEYFTEVVNSDRGTLCGCGVNFGTLEWCKNNYVNAELWKCLIEWMDLAGVVVPYNTDGKARCARLKLLEKIS